MLALNNWYNEVAEVRNEIVFKGRNKNYGAYQLRREYNQTLTNVLLFMIGTAILSYGIKVLIDYYYPQEEFVNTKVDITVIDIIATAINKDIEIVHPPASTIQKPVMNTQQFVVPKIVDDPVEMDELISQQKLTESESNIGTNTVEGNDENTIQVPIEGTGNENSIIEDNPPKIFTIVQEMPEFPGGQIEMIKYIQKNIVYPPSAREAGINGTCYLSFVVNEDGTISNVEVLKGVPGCPECDKEAIRVIKSMPLWIPGKQNGKEVKVLINLPIHFVLK